MAPEPKGRPEDASQKKGPTPQPDFVSKVTKKIGQHPNAVCFGGYKAKSTRKDHVALYSTLDFNEWWDIPAKSILAEEEAEGPAAKSGAVLLWVDKTQEVQYNRIDVTKAQAQFLRGRIARAGLRSWQGGVYASPDPTRTYTPYTGWLCTQFACSVVGCSQAPCGGTGQENPVPSIDTPCPTDPPCDPPPPPPPKPSTVPDGCPPGTVGCPPPEPWPTQPGWTPCSVLVCNDAQNWPPVVSSRDCRPTEPGICLPTKAVNCMSAPILCTDARGGCTNYECTHER